MGGVISSTRHVVTAESGELEKWRGIYSSSQKILLVGEGDFSFAACLASSFGFPNSIVATSLDTREEMLGKYTRAASNLTTLESLGCTVVHGVDVHSMNNHSLLHFEKFDRIVFNFPHAGFSCPEKNSYQIWLHQELVRGFLRSASNMLTATGEVHVTHKTEHPYNSWNVVGLAAEVGLELVGETPFHMWEFPGYQNKRGSGWNCDETFRVGQASTYMFKK